MGASVYKRHGHRVEGAEKADGIMKRRTKKMKRNRWLVGANIKQMKDNSNIDQIEMGEVANQ